MTGLSGSGKTTIAQEVERRLCEKGVAAYMLDGDKLRRGLCGDLGFSDDDRIELKHTIKNRRTLALGAVVAAEFLCGKKGVYTMDDLLK